MFFFLVGGGGIREIIGIEAKAWERGVLKCTFIYIPFLLTISVLCLDSSLFLVYSSPFFICVLLSIDYTKSLLSASTLLCLTPKRNQKVPSITNPHRVNPNHPVKEGRISTCFSLAMATKPPYLGESSTHFSREISPYFSLPNEDGSNPHQEHYSDQSQQQQYPPITLSCAQCERIIGDSSSFLFVTRQMGTVTLDRVVSVEVGLGGLKTSSEGEWDEFWYGTLTAPPAPAGDKSACNGAYGDVAIIKTFRAGNVPLY